MCNKTPVPKTGFSISQNNRRQTHSYFFYSVVTSKYLFRMPAFLLSHFPVVQLEELDGILKFLCLAVHFLGRSRQFL